VSNASPGAAVSADIGKFVVSELSANKLKGMSKIVNWCSVSFSESGSWEKSVNHCNSWDERLWIYTKLFHWFTV